MTAPSDLQNSFLPSAWKENSHYSILSEKVRMRQNAEIGSRHCSVDGVPVCHALSKDVGKLHDSEQIKNLAKWFEETQNQSKLTENMYNESTNLNNESRLQLKTYVG